MKYSLKPSKALHDISVQGCSQSGSDREYDQWRSLLEVDRIATNKEIVKQFHLLLRLKPLL